MIRAAVLCLSLIAAQLWADEVTFTLETAGAFNLSNPSSGTGFSTTATLFDLSFSGLLDAATIFRGTTTNGSAAVQFGTLTLGALPAVYSGNTFALDVLFISPFNITGGNSAAFVASLVGTVQTAADQVLVDFNHNPVHFTFAGIGGTSQFGPAGQFDLTVSDVSLRPGSTANLTGSITNATQAPEPGTAVLMAAFFGFAALLFALRSRCSGLPRRIA